MFEDQATYKEHHKGRCSSEDRKIQATKDGNQNQWHIIWVLMHGRLIIQTCCKENLVNFVSLPQNNVNFRMGMRRVINEQKGIIKTLNIANDNETRIQLLHYCQSTQQSLEDQQKTEAELAKLQFLTAQSSYDAPQGTHHNPTGVHVDENTGRQYMLDQNGNMVWLDETAPPPTPQSRYKSFQFIEELPEAQSP